MKEKFIQVIKNKWLKSIVLTLLLVGIIVCAYLAINYAVDKANITDIDMTKEKLYSISQETKDKLQNLDIDTTITLFNMSEYYKDFAYKYADLNEHIKVEELENLTSKADWKAEYGLQDTSAFIMISTADREKILYEYDLYTIDYTTYTEIDITEEAMTNAILDVATTVKPKVYFLTGHSEFALTTEMGTINTYLANESYSTETLNLISAGVVPEDCNLLVILNPQSDFTEIEAQAIKDYINKGGDIIFTADTNTKAIAENPNIQSILDLYGANLQNNGYIIEQDAEKIASSYPNVIIPEISSSNSITSEIYTDGYILMPYAGRVTFKSDDELSNLKVSKEVIVNSSSNSLFITDLNSDIYTATQTAEEGEQTIAALATKTITEETAESEALTSRILIIANTLFASDYSVEGVSSSYPVSYIANNKDFMLDAIANLTEREDIVKIRKDMSTSTYAPTQRENTIVLTIIFAVPVLIILIGIFVGIYRKRKR